MTVPLSELTQRRNSFTKGERVQAHPATDTWMRGDMYGNVVHVGRKLIHVLMDRSNKVRKFHPNNLLHIGE